MLPLQWGYFVGGKNKAPISSHPAFPAIVALWFAALLGIGSLVLPVALIEKLVTTSGVAAAWPAAQPPLGITARLAIALGAAGIGVLVGILLARKVAAAQSVEESRRRRGASTSEVSGDSEDHHAKRPISVRDELGSDALDSPLDDSQAAHTLPGLGRRRALSVSDDGGRSDFLESAPLPGGEAFDAVDALDLGAFDDREAPLQDVRQGTRQQIENFGSSVPSKPGPAPQAFSANDRAEVIAQEPVRPANEDYWQTASAEAAEVSAEEEDRPEPVKAVSPCDEPEQAHHGAGQPRAPIEARPLGELGMVELVERFALSLQRRHQAAAAPIALPQFKTPLVAAEAKAEAAPRADQAGPAESGTSADAEEPESDSGFAYPSHVPEALRPIFVEEPDDELDDPVPFGFALRLEAAPRPFEQPGERKAAQALEGFAGDPDPADVDDSELEPGDGGYASLLAMKSPLGPGRDFVRIEDEEVDEDSDDEIASMEPVVVFPGQPVRRGAPAVDGPTRDPVEPSPLRPFDGPAAGQGATLPDFSRSDLAPAGGSRTDLGETERSLREALEKLQRMSGAA